MPGEGWAWLIDRTGRIQFGKVSDNATRFQSLKERDLEVAFGDTVDVRLVMRDDLVDFYVNDYQVDYYHLTGDTVSGRVGLFSPDPGYAPQAWMPDPNYEDKSVTPKQTKETK